VNRGGKPLSSSVGYSVDATFHTPFAKLADLYGAPIGFLGGLIGLGDAEFRLPVLAGMFGYRARRAVALNLAISLITVVSALVIRARTLSLAPLWLRSCPW
jgi:uncharacterized membrane protein YfcA